MSESFLHQADQLRHDEVGDVVGDGRAEEDHAFVEQAREDVERALATTGLLDHEWYKWSHVLTFLCFEFCSLVSQSLTFRLGRRIGDLGVGLVGHFHVVVGLVGLVRVGLVGGFRRVFGGCFFSLGHRHGHRTVGHKVDRFGY